MNLLFIRWHKSQVQQGFLVLLDYSLFHLYGGQIPSYYKSIKDCTTGYWDWCTVRNVNQLKLLSHAISWHRRDGGPLTGLALWINSALFSQIFLEPSHLFKKVLQTSKVHLTHFSSLPNLVVLWICKSLAVISADLYCLLLPRNPSCQLCLSEGSKEMKHLEA